MNTTNHSGSLSGWKSRTRAALFVLILLLGVAVPNLIHLAAGPELGRSLLPIPFIVLLAGALFGWETGILSGILIPLLNHFISGMPLLPALKMMIPEYLLLGLLAGLSFRQWKWNAFLSILFSLILSRLLLALFFLIMDKNISFFFQGLKQNMPGLILQLFLLPCCINLFRGILDNK
ncbi:MAG: hypothetical protein PHF84_09315 [bacterium]|nr:hypothetical protein [bacterium]